MDTTFSAALSDVGSSSGCRRAARAPSRSAAQFRGAMVARSEVMPTGALGIYVPKMARPLAAGHMVARELRRARTVGRRTG